MRDNGKRLSAQQGSHYLEIGLRAASPYPPPHLLAPEDCFGALVKEPCHLKRALLIPAEPAGAAKEPCITHLRSYSGRKAALVYL